MGKRPYTDADYMAVWCPCCKAMSMQPCREKDGRRTNIHLDRQKRLKKLRRIIEDHTKLDKRA